MNGPQLPVTPKLCENVASPCSRCDNAAKGNQKTLYVAKNVRSSKHGKKKNALQRTIVNETSFAISFFCLTVWRSSF